MTFQRWMSPLEAFEGKQDQIGRGQLHNTAPLHGTSISVCAKTARTPEKRQKKTKKRQRDCCRDIATMCLWLGRGDFNFSDHASEHPLMGQSGLGLADRLSREVILGPSLPSGPPPGNGTPGAPTEMMTSHTKICVSVCSCNRSND